MRRCIDPAPAYACIIDGQLFHGAAACRRDRREQEAEHQEPEDRPRRWQAQSRSRMARPSSSAQQRRAPIGEVRGDWENLVGVALRVELVHVLAEREATEGGRARAREISDVTTATSGHTRERRAAHDDPEGMERCGLVHVTVDAEPGARPGTGRTTTAAPGPQLLRWPAASATR